MKKFCLLMFLLVTFTAFSENTVVIKNEFNEMTMNLYVEAEYKVDECIYVQVTLCESGKICNVGNKEKAFLSNR